jgi:type VI secretion system secreted protein VgrG
LYPDSLSGDKALNALGSFTLTGFSDSALTLNKSSSTLVSKMAEQI